VRACLWCRTCLPTCRTCWPSSPPWCGSRAASGTAFAADAAADAAKACICRAQWNCCSRPAGSKHVICASSRAVHTWEWRAFRPSRHFFSSLAFADLLLPPFPPACPLSQHSTAQHSPCASSLSRPTGPLMSSPSHYLSLPLPRHQTRYGCLSPSPPAATPMPFPAPYDHH
jgi:hypothetical protein